MIKNKGLTVTVKRVDRSYKKYANENMTVTMDLAPLIVNWQPLAMNRLVRFLRFMKFKSHVMKLELH